MGDFITTNASALFALAGALGGAAVTLFVAWWQRKSLEDDFIRRQRVDVVQGLLGYRYVLDRSYSASDGEREKFNFYANLFELYYRHDREVVNAFAKFRRPENRLENLIEILRIASTRIGLDLTVEDLGRTTMVLTSASKNQLTPPIADG